MSPLRRALDSPYLELALGLILFVAGMLEIRDIILVKMPNKGPMLPHAAATLGAALVLRSLPGIFLGLELADKALAGVTLRPGLAFLDRIAHSHAADLAMGIILLAAGAADLADILASGRAVPVLNTDLGAVVFGLAPALNAFLALYKGARRIDRERPERLLDRAVKNPVVQTLAGLMMLAGGAAEMWTAAHERLAPLHGAPLSGALALLGLFGLLTGLPGLYEGLRILSRRRAGPAQAEGTENQD